MSAAQAVAALATARHSFQQSLGVGRRSAKGFAFPVSVALDHLGAIYVLNRSSSWKDQFPRVTVISLGEEDFREIGVFGTEPGCLFTPTAVVIDKTDRLYIADEHLHTVSMFDCDGTFIARWGEPGSAPGQLSRPSGLALDSAGNVWVVDHGNSRVQCFAPDGRALRCFGSAGTGPGQLNLPWGIAVGPDDHIWVADWRNDRVQRFDPAGRHLGSYGEAVLLRPSAVAVAQDGTVYVADWGHDCVRVLDNAGRLHETWEGDATLSRWAREYLGMYDSSRQLRELAHAAGREHEERRFWQPSGIALGAGGLVLVADTGRHRVQVYRRDDQTSHGTAAVTVSEEESAVTSTATARRVVDPRAGTFDLWDLSTEEDFLLDLLGYVFRTWWPVLRFGTFVPGSVWEIRAPNAPVDVRLRNGTATVDFGAWHFHLCIGPYPVDPAVANLGGQLIQGKRTARAELGRRLDDDGAPVSWFLRLTAAAGNQQLTIWFPSPFRDDDEQRLGHPDWARLAAWDDVRKRYLGLDSDPADRAATGSEH
ncbi:MAG: NHL repeat-containing protein [Pseudonocardiaceae bacterium]